MKLMLYALFNYNMGGKIRRLSMNVTFKYIWPKGLNCLTHIKIVHLPEIGCVLLAYDCGLKKVVLGTISNNMLS
jgi:hypothetical protein